MNREKNGRGEKEVSIPLYLPDQSRLGGPHHDLAITLPIKEKGKRKGDSPLAS